MRNEDNCECLSHQSAVAILNSKSSDAICSNSPWPQKTWSNIAGAVCPHFELLSLPSVQILAESSRANTRGSGCMSGSAQHPSYFCAGENCHIPPVPHGAVPGVANATADADFKLLHWPKHKVASTICCTAGLLGPFQGFQNKCIWSSDRPPALWLILSFYAITMWN